jgi:hypothetical protein
MVVFRGPSETPVMLLQGILDDLDSRVPTGTALAAGVALASSWTAVSSGRSFVLVRRDCAYRQAIPKRKFAIDEVSRQANAKIGRNSPTRSAICLDGLILPGRKPEFYPRQVLANGDYVPQVLDALQIAGIMPAEVAVFGAIDERGDRPLSSRDE